MATRRRLFSEVPLAGPADLVALDRDESHHGIHVLRLDRGDAVLVFDAEGRQFAAMVERFDKWQMILRLGEPIPAASETRIPVVLYLALAKAAAFDGVLQRAAELGAAAIVPFVAERSVPQLAKGRDADAKVERWRQILLSATKQCGRARLTAIAAPRLFEEALRHLSESALRFCCAPTADAPRFSAALRLNDLSAASSVAVMIGPEGGLTESETASAQRHGWQLVSLGPRILRVETAATAAMSLVLAEMGDM